MKRKSTKRESELRKKTKERREDRERRMKLKQEIRQDIENRVAAANAGEEFADDAHIRIIDPSAWKFDVPNMHVGHALAVAFMEAQDVIEREEEVNESNVERITVDEVVFGAIAPVGNIVAPNGKTYQLGVILQETNTINSEIVETGTDALALIGDRAIGHRYAILVDVMKTIMKKNNDLLEAKSKKIADLTEVVLSESKNRKKEKSNVAKVVKL